MFKKNKPDFRLDLVRCGHTASRENKVSEFNIHDVHDIHGLEIGRGWIPTTRQKSPEPTIAAWRALGGGSL